jgi:putative tryptophan/tyrosine transport system substrate-binding protein
MRRRDFIKAVTALTAWPLTVRAQQPAIPVIGFLSSRSPQESADLVEAFRGGVKEGGFVEGQNTARDSDGRMATTAACLA